MWFVSEFLALVIMMMLALLWSDMGMAERQVGVRKRPKGSE